MGKREFSIDERKKEAFLRIAHVLYSHWRVSSFEEQQEKNCKIHSRIFDVLIPDEYVLLGKSSSGKKGREHVVPCVLVRDHAIDMFNNGYLIEDVAKMIESNLIIVHLSKEERVKLDKELKLKITMPPNWNFGDDPFERLSYANIEVTLLK